MRRCTYTKERLEQLALEGGPLPSNAHPPGDITQEEWFWFRVDRRGGADACWPWRASTRSNLDYGQCSFRMPDGRVQHVSHRVAFYLANDWLPEGDLLVRHTCDFGRCCNPAHLVAGTQLQNIADCIERGRKIAPPIRCGEDNHNAVLNWAKVREIRASYAAERKPRGLAKKFGVSRSLIRAVVLNKCWREAAP